MDRVCDKFEKLAYLVIFIITVLILWLAMPLKGSPKMFIVLSGSMEPEIHTGSIVVIMPRDKYYIGDIITFETNDTEKITTTHRIIGERIEGQEVYFATKGDANNAPDINEVYAGNVHGKVLFSISKLGYVLDFIRRPLSILIIVVIPAAFIVFDEIKKIVEEVKRMKDGKNKINKKN